MPQCGPVRGEELLGRPGEVLRQQSVLLRQRHGRQPSRIGIDAQRYSCRAEAINRMLRPGCARTRLHVTRRADLEVRRRRAQMIDETRVLDTPSTVTDARRMQYLQRLPHALGAARLTRVRGRVQAMLVC